MEDRSQVSAKQRVLVVCHAEAVWRRLEGLGALFSVARAHDDDAALAMLHQQHADLVLVAVADLGERRCARLRSALRDIDPGLPVTLLTPSTWEAGGEDDEQVERFAQGALATEAGRAALALSIERAVAARHSARAEAYGQRGRQRAAQTARKLLLGKSEVAGRLRDEIERAAGSQLNLLITGETGVGKSMVAEVVHASGAGSARPLVVVEPTTLPASLFESELFGHVRGAFTGAASTEIGAFEAADGGTLFLDEIGDLPIELQIKLLRAVESKIIRRLGDTRELHLDVRVITATNRDLEAQIDRGAFRSDLFHRLHEIRLHIPPLRERRADVIPLLEGFLAALREPDAPQLEIAAPVARRLIEHDWPGNVRELRTLARRLYERGLPALVDETFVLPIFPARIDRGMDSDGQPEDRIFVFKRRVYMEELAKHGFDIRATARALDLPYATLRSRLVSLDLHELVKQRRRDFGG